MVITALMLIAASTIAAASPFESSFENDFFNTGDSLDANEWFNNGFFNERESENEDSSQEDQSSNDDFINSDNWFDDDFFNERESEQEPSEEANSESEDYSGETGDIEQSEATEEEFVLEAPSSGDDWFEAESDSWVSYINPRDEYKRDFASYQGEGSGKLCVTLLNEDGEVIVGETLPDTQITIPTGDSLEWHPHAGPFTVDLPLTDNYERPLDADQFGTSPELVQGDGYMDSHCIEWHDLADDAAIEYGEAEVTGEYADDVEVVGYIQQSHDSWDTDVDPIQDAQSYDESGGGWTMYENGSHGQAVIVLQLDR